VSVYHEHAKAIAASIADAENTPGYPTENVNILLDLLAQFMAAAEAETRQKRWL